MKFKNTLNLYFHLKKKWTEITKALNMLSQTLSVDPDSIHIEVYFNSVFLN